jgi:hypothetical protein
MKQCDYLGKRFIFMFEVDRTFYINNQSNGKVEWYFQAREGDSGPYESKKEAQLMLKAFIQECIEKNKTGGRNPNETQAAQPVLNTGPRPKFKFRPKGVIEGGYINWY